MLETMLWGNPIKEYLVACIIVAFFFAIGYLISMLVVKGLKKIASKTKTTLDDILINLFKKPFVFTMFIFGFYLASLYVGFGMRGKEILSNILEIMIIINIIWIVIKLIDAIIDHYLMPYAAKTETDIDNQLIPFVRNLVKIIIIIIGAIVLIKRFGYDVTSLVAGVGIGGLALALAAQSMLSNFFGGVAILTDKPFKINDRIKVDDKYEGFVRQIGMRSTSIETLNSTIVTIPNSVIASSFVENITQEKARKILVNLGLTYDTPTKKIEEAIKLVKETLDENKYVVHDNKNCPKLVSFTEFKDFSLNILVIYFIKDVDNLLTAKTEINLAIKHKFEKAGIEFAFPTQTVYVKK